MAKSLKTLAQYGLQVFCLESLLGEHFKLFVLCLGFSYKFKLVFAVKLEKREKTIFMQSFPYKGQLTTWKDDRGFGFIKPDDGSKEVFLHISVLKGASRRPIAGDIIFYEKATEANGKIRASKASIQGAVKQSSVSNQRPHNSSHIPNNQSIGKQIRVSNRDISMQKLIPIVFLVGLGITFASPIINSVRGCNIKGNISVSTGDKLYHLPSMEDYSITNINESKGERWFCSESAAIASGWKKAPR